eukprot:11570499-Alexandrium_andersonii.AAC.1
MSASLVGSEMCIRDRNRRKPETPLPHCQASEVPREARRLLRLDMRDGGCLLYTSDAADDM